MTTYTDEKRPVPPVPDAKDANALYHDTRAPANTFADEKRPVPAIPDAKDANALYHDTRAPASPPPMPPRPRDHAVADNATRGHSRSSSIDADAHLPTILFAIPFPSVTKGSSHKDPISPYLIYALPRAPYQKPAVDEDGKKLEKEGLVKKAERKWQEEIAEGEKIRNGQDPDAGNWKKFKGKAVGASRYFMFVCWDMPLIEVVVHYRQLTK